MQENGRVWTSACGAVGAGTWAVLASIPEGACACGAEEHMASIGPPALGAKGCVERLHPTGETTHYDLCVAGAPANHVRCASLRSGGRRLAVRIMMECHFCALPRTPFPASRDFPSRGNERYEEKNNESYTSGTISAFSPFGGWRHHLARREACHWIRGSRGSPMNPVPLPPPQAVAL